MRYGFKNGAAEAIRITRRFAVANGFGGLECVDAQPHDQPIGTIREKGIIRWTIRFTGLPRDGPFDDGSVIVLVYLETGEARRLGGPGTA